MKFWRMQKSFSKKSYFQITALCFGVNGYDLYGLWAE